MDETLRDLYLSYVRAVNFVNAQVERKHTSEAARDAFRLKLLVQDEFLVWWAHISADKNLQSRWLERFADPAGYFTRTCRRITEELDRIPIQRVAA